MNLTKEQWQKIGGIVITAILAIAAVLGWFFPVSPGGEIGILLREKISIDARDDVLMYNGADQYVYSDDHSTQKFHLDGATGNIDAEGTGNFAGALTLQTGLTVSAGGATIAAGGVTLSDGDLVVADDVRVTAQTSITVTNGAAFTATGTYQAIAAAGEVTPTITCTQTDGSVLTLINTGSETINIEDTGNQVLSAAWAAGQYDVLVLWSDGTRWIEISRSDN